MSTQPNGGPNHTRRFGGLDLARVFGIIAIVAGHVWTDYGWHLPIFFVLNGILWRDGRTAAVEARRGFRRLLVPYAVWLVLIAGAFYGPAAARGELGLGKVLSIILGGSQLGRPFSAFWFVTALFTTAVLMRVLARSRTVAWGVALVGLGATYGLSDVIVHVPWSLGLAPTCMFFVLVGVEVWPRYQRIRRHGLISAVGLSVSIVVLAANVIEPIDIKQADLGTPVLGIVAAVMMSFGIIDLSQLIVGRLPRLGSAATWLVRPGLIVILAHAAVLQVLKTPSSGSVVAFAAALVIPWCLALIVGYRLPALRPALLGQQRIRPAPAGKERVPTVGV